MRSCEGSWSDNPQKSLRDPLVQAAQASVSAPAAGCVFALALTRDAPLCLRPTSPLDASPTGSHQG